MFRKFAMGFAVLLLVLFAMTLVRYSMWKSEKLETLRASSQIVDTRVGQIEYTLEAGEGPVLLFVHGTPGGYDQAPSDFPGYRLLAPSRPGYLRTPIEVGRTAAEQAEALGALLDALEIREVVVMGVSGGGPSAITFAVSDPNRVRALVTLEAVSQSIEVPDAPGFMDSDFLFWFMFDLIEHGPGFESILEGIVPNPEIRKLILEDSETLEGVKAVLWSGWPPSLRRDGVTNDIGQFENLTLPLAEVLVPTLIIHGTSDNNVPFSHAERLAEKVPGARLHAIADADHMMPFTHEEEIRTVFEDFVDHLDD